MIILFISENHDAWRDQWIKNNPSYSFYNYTKCISCCGELGEVLSDLYDISKVIDPQRKDHLQSFYRAAKEIFMRPYFKSIRCGTFKP